MSKTKKIDKEFLLTDNSVNCYGFRLLTEGYLLDEYKKNPIGYAMHRRDDGVLVRWEDFRLEGDKVWAKPVINLSHDMGQRTVDEIENGFLNGASVGHIVVIETSEEASLKLDGQTGPTITKWYNREASLVDVPGNFNALVKLYDVNDQPIPNLSDFTKPQIPTMKQIILSAAHFAALNLKADADESAVTLALNDLVSKAAEVDGLKTKYANLQAEVTKTKVSDLITAGLAAKKFTKEFGDQLGKDYATNPEGLKNLIDAMPVYSPVVNQLNAGVDKEFGKDLADKSWDELMESGKLEDLKAKNPDLYAQIYKREFGEEPKKK